MIVIIELYSIVNKIHIIVILISNHGMFFCMLTIKFGSMKHMITCDCLFMYKVSTIGPTIVV